MKITILTSGSRGDTQPYIALALALMSDGHDVRLATEQRVQPLIEEFGVPYFRVAGDPTAVLNDPEAQLMLRNNETMKLLERMQQDMTDEKYQQQLNDYEAACDGADMIISAALTMTQGLCIAERNGVPFLPMLLFGGPPSADAPLFLVSNRPLLFGFLNRWVSQGFMWLYWKSQATKINEWRTKKLGLPALTESLYATIESRRLEMLIACSRHIYWNSRKPDDWDAELTHLTGFAFVPPTPEDRIAPELREFIAASSGADGPVYLGFGSMPAPNPIELVEWAVSIVNDLGIRAILCAGWSDLDRLINPQTSESGDASTPSIEIPPSLLIIKSAPHDWLFPRVSAVVHHCGIGTCAAAMRAGTPSIPAPVLLDQFSNAERLFALGIATKPEPFHKRTWQSFANDIKSCLSDAAMRERARSIADDVAAEPGVEGAKAVVYQVYSRVTGHAVPTTSTSTSSADE